MENLTDTKLFFQLMDNQYELAKFFIEKSNAELKHTKTEWYAWNIETTLWELQTKDHMTSKIAKFYTHHLTSLLNTTQDGLVIQKLGKLLSKISDFKYSKNIYNHCTSMAYDKIFECLIDATRHTINFLNGVLNLKNGEFRIRNITDYYSKCLNYDYSNIVSISIISDIKRIFLRICNNDIKMYNFAMSFFGYAITGEITEQLCMFFLGYSASNGKSTMLEIIHKVFDDIYCFKLNKDTFELGNKVRHKQIISCQKPVRIVYVEELSQKHLDADFLNDFISGSVLNVDIMYGTNKSIINQSKLFIASNNNPRTNGVQPGTLRRLLGLVLQNTFVKSKKDIDEKNNKYLIEDVKKLFDNLAYKHALISLLLEQSIKYYSTGLKIPQYYKDTFNEIYDENDKFKHMIVNYFEQTENDKDRVNKDELVDVYNNIYKTKLDFSILLKDVKRLNLKYEKGLWWDGIRGCITKLRRLNDDERKSRTKTNNILEKEIEEKKIEDSDDDEPEPPKQEQKPEPQIPAKQEINYESDNELFDDNSSIIKKCVFGKVNNCVFNVQNMTIQQTETKPEQKQEVPKRLHTNKRINKTTKITKEKCVFGRPKQEINEEERKELDKVCGDVDDDFGLTINWE